MARWITKTINGTEVLRVREGFQFTWSGVTFPANYIENASDAELEERGFTVEEIEDPITPIKIDSISRRQFFQGLAKAPYTIIGEDEALAAMAGVIPAVLLEFIKLLPESQQFDVKMLLAGAQSVFEKELFAVVLVCFEGSSGFLERFRWHGRSMVGALTRPISPTCNGR